MKNPDFEYRRLQRHLDQMPIPFPATQTGVELRLLKHLFTPEETAIAVAMSAIPEPVERIQKRLKGMHLTVEELRAALDRMVEKGAIMGGPAAYGRAPLVIGMFEMQVDRLTKDFVQDFHAYQDEAFRARLLTKKTSQMRTVPINVEVGNPFKIGRYDDIRGYICGVDGPFGVMNCVCRQAQKLFGHTCTKSTTNETCLTIGRAAVYMRKRGNARLVSREEVLAVLDRAERDGLVLQPQNTQTPTFVCCCCSDCCEVLQGTRELERPAEFFRTNFLARVDDSLCAGCGTCVKRCPMDAITVVEDRARVDVGRCIGCGLCASRCKKKAARLQPRDWQGVPPRNQDEMYRRIMLERFGPLRTLAKGARMALGMKI
jgi:Na+-translocating ferredoxin:NAD+ oxidoreductase subunit B